MGRIVSEGTIHSGSVGAAPSQWMDCPLSVCIGPAPCMGAEMALHLHATLEWTSAPLGTSLCVALSTRIMIVPSSCAGM